MGLELDPLYLDCDLVADELDTDGIRGEATVALLSDARADPALLRVGQLNRGYWEDAFEVEPTAVGSLLWLFEPAVTDEKTSEAQRIAETSLAPMIAEGRVERVEIEVVPEDQQLVMTTRLILPDGSTLLLSPFRVN